MLRLEEVQFVNWGPLRPDTVPFMTNAVNLITGTNGSAKTCFVNGIKVLLGVRFSKDSAPREYIFNPIALQLGQEVAAADRAVLRGTFTNPYKDGHRAFEYEGIEFQSCEHVTVVCLVQQDSIRYRILPGRVAWKEPISMSLERFFEENPPGGRNWKGPQVYDQSLTRLGVSQAMRGVLALPQGETGEILKKSPGELLKTILQLTGKQSILDAYAEQRKDFEAAQIRHRETSQNLTNEKTTLAGLERDAEKFEEWNSYRLEHDRLRDVLIPAAEYRDLVVDRDRKQAEFDGLNERVAKDAVAFEQKERDLPEREQELSEVRSTAATAKRKRDSAERRLSRLRTAVSNLQREARVASAAAERAAALIAGRSEQELTAAGQEAEGRARASRRALDNIDAEVEQLRREAEQLRAGYAPAPQEVQDFRTALAESGIAATLVADVLEPAGAPARQIEAALGAAVWGLVVAGTDFDRAVVLARDRQYGFPVARAGSGNPVAVLAATSGPDDLRALLADLDVASVDNVGGRGSDRLGAGADGFYHLPSVAHLRAPAIARIGAAARAERLAHVEARLGAARDERPGLADVAKADAQAASELAEAMEAWPRMPAMRQKADQLATRVELATAVRVEASTTLDARKAEADDLTSRESQLRLAVERLQAEITVEGPQLQGLRTQLETLGRTLADARSAVDMITLTEAQAGVLDAAAREDSSVALAPTDELRRNLDARQKLIDNEERYPQHLRSDQVLTQRDEQAVIVRRAEEALEGVGKDMEAHQAEVDRARATYDMNVGATIRILNTRFAQICEAANMVGELHRLSAEGRGEYGLDVRVAHKLGERPISYQRRNFHSGGQTVKIAILLLLAAMSMGDEGSEMLIMDEPIAHMSVENADQIAEVIVSLKDRAQFILAMPTNAETLRVDWAEWQISLLAREPGQPRSPVPQIMSELKEDPEARFGSPQLALETA